MQQCGAWLPEGADRVPVWVRQGTPDTGDRPPITPGNLTPALLRCSIALYPGLEGQLRITVSPVLWHMVPLAPDDLRTMPIRCSNENVPVRYGLSSPFPVHLCPPPPMCNPYSLTKGQAAICEARVTSVVWRQA